MRASRPSSADISSPAGTPPTLRLTRRLERIRRKPSITSTHYVVRTNAPRLPLWFNEGLAEFFSTFEYRKGELRIGLPKPSHVLWLRNHSAILIPALFAMDRDSKDYNEGTRRGIFYAQSWALVHYLIARDSDLRSRIPDFFAGVSQGLSGDQAFREAFGITDFRKLQHELHSYLRRSILPYWRVMLDSDPELAGPAVTSRRMEWHEVLYRLGDLLSHHDEWRGEAESHFAAALEANPEHGLSLAGHAYLAELDERSDDARRLYERAARLAPDEYLVQYRYAASLDGDASREARDRARAAFSRAASLRPQFGEAWAGLGGTYVDESSPPDAAVEALERAHRLLPSRVGVLYDLGRVHEARRDFEPAIAAYDRVIGLDPEHQWAFACRGRVFRNLERYDEALASLDEAVRLDASYTFAHNQRGLTHSDAERFEEAVAAFDAAIQADPTYKWAHASKAQALGFLHRDEEALLAVDAALRIDPQYEWALAERERVRERIQDGRFLEAYNRALEQARHGDHDAAESALEALIQTTEDPGRLAEARKLLAWVRGIAK